jgi:hypothetical protein
LLTAIRIRANVVVIDQIQGARERHYANIHSAFQPKTLFDLIHASECERAKCLAWSWLRNLNIAGLLPAMSISIKQYEARRMIFKSIQLDVIDPDVSPCNLFSCPCRYGWMSILNNVDTIFDSVTGLCLDCVVAMARGSEESVCLNSHEQGLHRANAASTRSSS